MSCWTRTRFVQAIETACCEHSSWDAGNKQDSPSLSIMSETVSQTTCAHPSSQSGGPVVTESGEIQMQTFSVTQKVHILAFHLVLSIVGDHQNYVLTLLCCHSCREKALTTWRPQLSSQVCSRVSPVLGVHQAEVCLKDGASVRCSGLPTETSGGFCKVERLCGHGNCPGDSHPRSFHLCAGGSEPERHGLQRKRPRHGCSDGWLGKTEDLVRTISRPLWSAQKN